MRTPPGNRVRPLVTVAIDTEEDNWGTFLESGATVANIRQLPMLQEIFDRWGVRPTYLVNRPPLMTRESVEILGTLAERDDVEIGGHCHPWNTPPSTGEGEGRSWMWRMSYEDNLAKIQEVTSRIESELGVRPTTFRAGRWGFGPNVARALHAERYLVDCSVTPFIDWSRSGGPDFNDAPDRPYRFKPEQPLVATRDGSMIELPTTIGFLRGTHRTRAAWRRRLERSWIRHLKVISVLDRVGLLTRRWLSPEASPAEDMIGLCNAMTASGEPILGITFHSCTLLPGSTPFVRTGADLEAFVGRIDTVLQHCHSAGYDFLTLGEAGAALFPEHEAQL